ncbi:hypothetical protein COCSUDRAFT_57169 [Coccomyxa subellipsoidea C-169]|uniref:Uncharacterized protein n=1 Tax=Coccomyxa subellipsoidea (strain C-169) TaxID=574566 RepID=I0YS98_COCSC|nr:hypothetical protein COCSUDRAFT_57169 [Coccomyxa subellipsoidea C-169]EIE21267.1 hypothetical protein COCSUDRAFT_57169 [Coccomyxa subellipsoidea C-169]|eukprot:XP_005645811.1 hypothetical protein COCSUDRAFT_57169 [Coccomyxa subellipsoidea C-169]
MSGNPRDIRRASSCRFTDEGVQSSTNGGAGRFEVLDLQIALAMAQMPLEGVPARIPSSWPAEAWIMDGDQKMALLSAFQMHISRNENIWWPQYASILFPDRHLGSAQNRWFAAERAAQILAKALFSGCEKSAATLDAHPPPFLILYHLLVNICGTEPLQAYTDSCIICNRDPACMPWAGVTEEAVCAAFPAFRTGQIYSYLWSETDSVQTDVLKWAEWHQGHFALSSYLLHPRLPKRTKTGAGREGFYSFGITTECTTTSGYTPSLMASGSDFENVSLLGDCTSSDDESLDASEIARRSLEKCHIAE